MANALPNEQELYDKIQKEKITVPLLIWDMMYHYLGDDISAVAQITLSHLRYREPIPIADGKKILGHTKRIKSTLDKILHPEKINGESGALEELMKEETPLHPVIHELFFHYIGNDVYGINMIAGFHLDPADENPIPLDHSEKILNKAQSLMRFLDRLREATHLEVPYQGEEKG